MSSHSPQKLSEKDFQGIIDKAPLVSIDIVVQNSKGEIFLGLRNNKPAQDFWFVPGGRILKNEKIEEAFKRIVNKELKINIEFKNAELLGVFDHIYKDNKFGLKDINTHYVSIAFKIHLPPDKQTIVLDEQHRVFKWLSVESLMQETLVHENTKMFFQN